MPLLLTRLSVFLAGAFAGSQVDDAIDQPPAGVPETQKINPTKIFLYGAGALALFWGAQKAGLIKK